MNEMKRALWVFGLPALLVLGALLLSHSAANAQVASACGPLENHYGPFDYRGREGSKRLVERAHFTPGVENLTSRMTGPFGTDIRYTLWVFPNHYRALQAMERLAEKEKTDPPMAAVYTVECYYDRALRFVPDDHGVRLLYANFLIKKDRRDEALVQLDYVTRTTLDNPLAQLNVGRIYLDMKEYDKALQRAHHLIGMGFDRQELRGPLTAAGKWVEPPAQPAASAVGADMPVGASAPQSAGR